VAIPSATRSPQQCAAGTRALNKTHLGTTLAKICVQAVQFAKVCHLLARPPDILSS